MPKVAPDKFDPLERPRAIR